ncbi:CLC-B [Symbiodinium microadriaticum]|nr:CLC-B [Symbiodinium microadriaticum]
MSDLAGLCFGASPDVDLSAAAWQRFWEESRYGLHRADRRLPLDGYARPWGSMSEEHWLQAFASRADGDAISADRRYLTGEGGRMVLLHDYRDMKFLKRLSAVGMAASLMSSSGLAYAVSLGWPAVTYNVSAMLQMCVGAKLYEMQPSLQKLSRSKFARVELLYTGAMMLTNVAGDETGWWVDVHQLSRILAIPVDQIPWKILLTPSPFKKLEASRIYPKASGGRGIELLLGTYGVAVSRVTRTEVSSSDWVVKLLQLRHLLAQRKERTGAADLIYLIPRIEELGCKSCLRGSVSGGTEVEIDFLSYCHLHPFLIRKADFSEAKYFEHLPVQVEQPAGQTRSRAPGPLPPPSPPQIPGAVYQNTYVWGLVDQQILMQVCTVLFTLLVVALVKQVTAWWQGNSTPKVRGRKHTHGGSPMPATAADPDAEGGPASTTSKKDPDDAGQQKTKEDTRVPDKTTVTADGSSPKTSTSPSPGTTVPSGPQTTTTSDDKKSGSVPAATTSDPKAKSGVDGPTGGGTTVTPHSMLQEIQAVHKLVKTLIDGGAPPDMKKVNGEMENLRKDVTTIMKFLSSSEKDLKDVTGRLAALETVLGSVNSRVCTLSTNLDIHAKSTESYLKEALKSISVVGGAAKTFHADTQVLIGAKHDNLEQGIKSCINKVTNCDYETHTALSKTLSDLSKQTYDMGQELLAALHFVQSEQGTTKDNLWQIANVLADTVEQVKIIRDYCERPVPVNVQNAGGSSTMPPPPSYEPSMPSIHGPRQQLHLQTAIPAARTGTTTMPQVNIDMGDGRTINIPVHL